MTPMDGQCRSAEECRPRAKGNESDHDFRRHLRQTPPPIVCPCLLFEYKCSGLVQAVYQLSLLIPPCFHSSQSFIGLCRILSQHVLFKLRLVLHPTLWGHWILPANPWVLCLHVLLICHLLLLFGGHVLRLHTSATGHAGLGSWNLRVIDVFG